MIQSLRGLLATTAAGVLLAGCGQARRAGSSTTTATASASASASSPPALRSSGSALGPADAGTATAMDPDEAILMREPLVRLRRRGTAARPGVFDAAVGSAGAPREIVAEPALVAAPTAYRAPLAFYRLAHALGMHVVPVSVLRPVPLGELGDALGPDAAATLGELRVQNDGTVDVLLSTRSSASAGSPWNALGGTPIDVEGSRDVGTLERWAAAETPAAGEDSALLRDYVEMLVLDYLTANDARRQAVRVEHGLVLADNASAFPLHPDRPTVERLLRRLKGAARFPRGLREALGRLDREHAAAALNPGGFETWLVSPRVLIELDERRAALLTLVEARVADRGAAAVLTL